MPHERSRAFTLGFVEAARRRNRRYQKRWAQGRTITWVLGPARARKVGNKRTGMGGTVPPRFIETA